MKSTALFEVEVDGDKSLTGRRNRYEFFTWRGARAFAVQQLPATIVITDLKRQREIFLEPTAKVQEEAERYRCRSRRDQAVEQDEFY